MKILTLPILAASFALVTIAMADTTTPSTKVTTEKAQKVAPVKTEAAKTDKGMTCSMPMNKPMGCMHCGM